MSRSPHRPPAEAVTAGPTRPGLPVVVLATLAVLVTAADTYVVVLALPDILTGVGVGIDELQRATPIIGGFLLGYTATLPLLGRLADLRGGSGAGRLPAPVRARLSADGHGRRPGDGGPRARTAGHRRRRTRAGHPRAGRRPLAARAARAPARRRRCRRRRPARCSVRWRARRSSRWPDWRAIFWVNLVLGLALGGRRRGGWGSAPSRTGGPGPRRPRERRPRAPARRAGRALVEDVTLGLLYVPLVPSLAWSTPLTVVTRGGHGGACRPQRDHSGPGRAPVARAAPARRPRSTSRVRRWPSCALGSLVWAFAAADPAARSWRTARCSCPSPSWRRPSSWCTNGAPATRVLPLRALRPVGAWGALVVNLLVGVALVAALVDVPLFARNTTTPGDQLGAALVLLRLLVAVPVGAVAGGWLCRVVPPRIVAAGGMALAARGLRRDDDVGRDGRWTASPRPSSWCSPASGSGWPSRR